MNTINQEVSHDMNVMTNIIPTPPGAGRGSQQAHTAQH